MATQVFYTGDGSTLTWDVTFPFRSKDDVKASVDGVDTSFTWASASAIQITPAVGSGKSLRLYRKTDITNRAVDFTDGSVLTENDLDTNSTQALYSLQEADTRLSDLEGRVIMVPAGESSLVLPGPSERAGRFLTFDGAGKPVVSNGTGVDPGLRQDLADTTEGLGAALVRYAQNSPNAASRTVLDKTREVVSIEDFLVPARNPSAALELASAVARVVNLGQGKVYSFDSSAQIAANTVILMNDAEINALSGYTDTHFIEFTGTGAIRGPGTMRGDNLPAPVATWAGVGIPPGIAIYAAGTSQALPLGAVQVEGITFTGFKSGAIYFKYVLDAVVRDNVFTDNQTSTLMYKSAGNYAYIPTTNVLANERVTSAVVETYMSDNASVLDNTFRFVRSKGLSCSGLGVRVAGNNMAGASPRHCLCHVTETYSAVAGATNGGAVIISNTFDGGADLGDAIKVVNAGGTVVGPNTIRSSNMGLMIQDSSNVSVSPQVMSGITGWAYQLNLTDAATGDLKDIEIMPGTCLASGAAAVGIGWSVSTGAVAAGYKLKNVRISGGKFSGFNYGFLCGTPGNAATIENLQIVGKANFDACLTLGLDLRVKSVTTDVKITNSAAGIALGNITGVPGTSAEIKASFDGCTGILCQVGATYDFNFDTVNLDLIGRGGTRLAQIVLDGSDSLKLFKLRADGYNQTTTGSAISIDAGGKTVKARIAELALLDPAGALNNIQFLNAASLTGYMKDAIAGVTGSHGLTTA